MAYGERSRFVQTVRTPMTMIGHIDLHGNPDGLDARTPLSELTGTITPSALHYVSSHGNNPPDIDPREHRLMVYGLVDRPLVFTMEELTRLPSVTRVNFIECIANAPRPEEKTVDQMHGMIACSEWTGVPLSVLLDEVGVKDGAGWVLSEGAEATKLGASMPMGKATDDVLVAYGQNGEPLRPHQGFPLRLVVPGFQGKYHIKWLRRIRVVDRPYVTYWEKHSYTKRQGTARTGPNRMANSHTAGEGSYFMEQGPKSVITFPSGEQRLPGPGFFTISGLAWSGSGAVRRVEVSTDGGRSWNDAAIDEPARRMAWTRFTAPWTWNGGEAMLQSRCTDEKGQVQPTADKYRAFWGTSGAPHGNAIQPWRVTNEGHVLNAL
jgi:sulfane dehydrogenase subunit SoxC